MSEMSARAARPPRSGRGLTRSRAVQLLVGVYDGHGQNGELCSEFICFTLSDLIEADKAQQEAGHATRTILGGCDRTRRATRTILVGCSEAPEPATSRRRTRWRCSRKGS